MTKLGALFLLVASVAWGQASQICGTTEQPPWDKDCRHVSAEKAIQVPAPQVAPLKCGKYQHFEPTGCGSFTPNNKGIVLCNQTTPDRCVDDLHTVTEREWQELIARLKALEYTAILCQKDGKDITCDSEIHKEAHTLEVTIP